ncbi:SBBP repeat-containing protein [candidate division WOR-3 bacterium]|nr:SBBP repeat-containing protein [candidate division WOR-3 bacterium]
MKKILVLSIVTISMTAIITFAAEPVEEWVRTRNINYDDAGNDIAVDSDGNVYVVGQTGTGSDRDALIIKYDKDGNELWYRKFDRNTDRDDVYYCVAVDAEGYIYAGGSTENETNTDVLIVKYNPDGDSLWVRILDTSLPPVELFEEIFGIAVDDSYVYVTGSYHFNDVAQARTMVYDKYNDHIRTGCFDTEEYDVSRAIAVDDDGYMYVAGGTGTQPGDDFLVVKYDSLFDTVWTQIHNPGTYDLAFGIALDDVGNVYVVGTPGGGEGGLYVVRFNNDGNLDGDQNYAPYNFQMGYDVVVSGENVYLTGYKEEGSPKDVLTICYDKEWNLKWEKDYNTGTHESGHGIAVDNKGYLYVAGSVASDVLTIKYRLPGDITVTWPNGGENLVVGTSYPVTWKTEGVIDSVMLEFTNESVVGMDTIAVVANTGSYMWTVPDNPGTQTKVFISDRENYSDVRDASDADFSIIAEGVEEAAATSISLEVFPDGLIRYQIPVKDGASLKIYAMDGSLVLSEAIVKETGESRCDGFVPGVYFVRLITETGSVTRKLLITK